MRAAPETRTQDPNSVRRSALGDCLLAFNNEHPEKTVVGEVNFGPGLDFGHVLDRFLDVFEL